MIPDGTRVIVRIDEGAGNRTTRGRLNGNYDGSGPVQLTTSRGAQICVPGERVITVVEERPSEDES